MFQVNDYVVYGNSGVCKILEIGTPDIGGIDKLKEYYTLQPLYSKGSLIYTPMENEKSIMRGIISKEDALLLISEIPHIDTIKIGNDKLQEIKYREAMKKYECREWIRIIKTLYLKNQNRLQEGKRIGSIDTRYLHDAKESLHGELSISLGIPKDKMEDFITEKVNQMTLSL